jgi:thiamine-monophosphate kinase
VQTATDISDGFVIDLNSIADASNVGMELDLDRIPISKDARKLTASMPNSPSALEHALYDGEDFELILIADPDETARILADEKIAEELTLVGKVIDEKGIWQRQGADRSLIFVDGYVHGTGK